jgi:hypothetical protein
MTIFEILFVPTIIVAMALGYYAVKHNWKLADFF